MFLNYYYYYHHHSLSLVSFCRVLSLARPLLRVAARLHHQGNVAAGSRARALTHAHNRAGGCATLMSKNDGVCVASAVFRGNGLPTWTKREGRLYGG